MILEVCFIHYVVYETCRVLDTCGICCRVRTVKGEMELEVRELLLKLGEVFKVEGLDKCTSSIEEADLAAWLRGWA